MKKTSKMNPIVLFVFLLFIQIIILPIQTADCARQGLVLWYQNLLPSLFPFMILSGMIIRLKLFPFLSKLFHPILGPLFRLSPACEYVIVTGFLCGFPMGAHTIASLTKEGELSSDEATLLLLFCNNLSPAFFVGIVLPLFPKQYSPCLLGGMYLIPLAYGLLLRHTFYRKRIAFKPKPISNHSPPETITTAVDDSITNAIQSILKLGGYLIFFQSFRAGLLFFRLPRPLQVFLDCMLEITCGIKETALQYRSENPFFLYLIVLIHPGGLCCLFQTLSCLSGVRTTWYTYLLHKTIQALLWLILMFLAVTLT